MQIKIAVLLTVHNRKVKTLACLHHLFDAVDAYHLQHGDDVRLSTTVFLTDDGCTDGTADAVMAAFPQQDINILQGTGTLYWAGGMRFAWNEAFKYHQRWTFYLLLNDDTNVMDNVFAELLATHRYSLQTFGKSGIYSGITCDIQNRNIITYGGDVYLTAARTKWKRLSPSGLPQLVDKTNANILLVSHEVVEKVGIFYDGYIHGGADEDYGIVVRKAGLPALVTGAVCGKCPFDHTDDAEVCKQLSSMSLHERIQYVHHPVHGDHDYLLMVRRQIPKKFLVSWTLRKIRCYMPSLYLMITKARGVYK